MRVVEAVGSVWCCCRGMSAQYLADWILMQACNQIRLHGRFKESKRCMRASDSYLDLVLFCFDPEPLFPYDLA